MLANERDAPRRSRQDGRAATKAPREALKSAHSSRNFGDSGHPVQDTPQPTVFCAHHPMRG